MNSAEQKRIVAILIGVVLIALMRATPQGERAKPAPATVSVKPEPPPSPWLSLAGNVWPGAKLYRGKGETKTQLATIVTINDRKWDPTENLRYRGVLLRYPTGDESWLNRDKMLASDEFFVRRDDPAVKKWREGREE